MSELQENYRKIKQAISATDNKEIGRNIYAELVKLTKQAQVKYNIKPKNKASK